jgi:Fe-S-cluster containining protein
MTSQQENPCISCGICCSNFRVSFYHGEIEGMPCGWVPAHLVEKLTESRACMQGTSQKNPRCVALSGTLGAQTACTIYAQRPSPCREFEAWEEDGLPNERCQKLRVAHGLARLQPRLPG